MIKINETLTIPFYRAQPIGYVFPLFLRNVTIRTANYTNNSPFNLTKVGIALERLLKLLRHPQVLQQIAKQNFSLWCRKNYRWTKTN